MLKHIGKTQGITGLWRGFIPTIAASIPAASFYYIGYEYIRDTLSPILARNKSVNYNIQKLTYVNPESLSPLISGSLARMVTGVALSPVELIRTRLQSNLCGSSISEVCFDLKTLTRNHGISSLWKGLLPTLFRDVPFSAIYWSIYESSRESEFILSSSHYIANNLGNFKNNNQSNGKIIQGSYIHFIQSFLTGAFAGSVAAVITTPFDVVKTVQQVQSSNSNSNQYKDGMIKLLLNIGKNEGLSGMFKGLIPRLIKVAPSCAIFISSYEVGKHIFLKKPDNNYNDPPEEWNSVPTNE